MAFNSLFFRGFFRLADPKISLASFAGIFMAACFAAHDTGLNTLWLLLTIAESPRGLLFLGLWLREICG